MMLIACKGQRGRGWLDRVDNGTPRPLAGLLRETNYASLTTKCLTVPGVCTLPNTRPTTEWTQHLFSVQLEHGDQVKSILLYTTAATVFSTMSV